MTSARAPIAWRGPVAAWAVMLGGLAAVLFAATTEPGALRFAIAMGGSALMLAALALGLVGLARAKPLLWLIAGAGFIFIAVMFLLSFADVLTRLR